MDKNHRLPFPMSEEHYETIGALTAHYSYVELLAAMGLWSMLKLAPYNGALVT